MQYAPRRTLQFTSRKVSQLATQFATHQVLQSKRAWRNHRIDHILLLQLQGLKVGPNDPTSCSSQRTLATVASLQDPSRTSKAHTAAPMSNSGLSLKGLAHSTLHALQILRLKRLPLVFTSGVPCPEHASSAASTQSGFLQRLLGLLGWFEPMVAE